MDALLDVIGTADHARGGGADLDKVLADGLAVEHGVERRDLVHADLGHAEQLGDGVHRRKREPAAVLPLCNVEHGDYRGALVLHGEVRDDALDALKE